MPPKVKIAKEDIVNAAVAIVRNDGVQNLNARTVAAALGCSTQPVFSNFATMQELRLAVAKRADDLYQAYVKQETESGQYTPYKASGMAYIRFAKEETELFRLLYMRDRSEEQIVSETEFPQQLQVLVQRTTGLPENKLSLFHLEMWAYVHGVATMFATGYLDLPWELVSRMLTDAYQGLKKQYETEE